MDGKISYINYISKQADLTIKKRVRQEKVSPYKGRYYEYINFTCVYCLQTDVVSFHSCHADKNRQNVNCPFNIVFFIPRLLRDRHSC